MYQKIDKSIYRLGSLYFFLPIFLLTLFWFKWYISIPIISCMIFIYYKFINSKTILTDEEYKNLFNKKWIILIPLIIVFCILSGAGGIQYQNWDYNARNAVLNDLINDEWPVKYHYNDVDASTIGIKDGILSYYFTYWLPAAGIGKILGMGAAHIFLLLWQILGLTLFFYFLARYFKKTKVSYFFIFFAFSGLDIIGNIACSLINGQTISLTNLIGIEHIDTFGSYFCFSSFVTQVFWVFNQAIPALIITMILMNEKNYKNIGILMLMLFPFAPLPAIGLMYIILIFMIFGFDCKEKINYDRIKQIFSIQNILCLICVIPIAYLFFANAGSHDSGLIFSRPSVQETNLIIVLMKYLVLMILEVYIYIAIIANKENRRFLLLVALFLSIIPFYYIGIGLDFCNRVSIPCLVIILCYVIKYFD